MTKAWVLGNGTSETENYSNKYLMQALRSRGVDVRFVDILKIQIPKEGIYLPTCESLLYEDGTVLTPPDLVIISNAVHVVQKNRFFLITEFLKRCTNTVFVNEVDSHVKASSKHTAYQILQENNIPIPAFEVIQPNQTENTVAQNIGFPVVVKPVNGSLGKNVVKCNDESEMFAAIENIRKETIPSFNDEAPVIVQALETSGAGLMVSVGVIGEKLLACYNIGSPYAQDEFKCEMAIGRSEIACNIDSELENISKNIMRALNLEYARLDFFATDSGYKLCEVNCPAGGINRIDRTNNVEQLEEVVDYALAKLGSR